MADTTVTFKGFKQVKATTYNNTPATDKLGYVWFVRPDSATTETKEGDIYFGTRLYGHSGNITTEMITSLKNYVRAEEYTPIAQTDTLNQALGKLEGAVYGIEELLARI